MCQHQLPFCMWRLFQDSATNLWCLKRRLVFPQFLDSFHTYMAKLYKYILCNSSSKWAKIQEKWFSLLAAQLNGPSLLCGHFGKRCAILHAVLLSENSLITICCTTYVGLTQQIEMRHFSEVLKQYVIHNTCRIFREKEVSYIYQSSCRWFYICSIHESCQDHSSPPLV